MAHPTRYLALLLTISTAAHARRHRVEGMVLRVDSAKREILVSHAAVPGVMPAMVMPFQVRDPRELRGIVPGTRIRFEYHAAQARKLVRLGESIPGVKLELSPPPVIGRAAPDFTLTNQLDQQVTLSSLRGKTALIQFLYTRCPLPEVCPRLAASFASLQRRYRDQMDDRLVLLSISLDPAYDTPTVLAEYAGRVGAGRGWHFLTGDTAAVARAYGLLHWAEEGMIVHTSVTALVDRDGRLAAVVDGSSYRLEQLADLVRHSLN